MKKILCLMCVRVVMAGCSAGQMGGKTAGDQPAAQFKTGAFHGTSVTFSSDGKTRFGKLSIKKEKDGSYSVLIDNFNLSQTPSATIKEEVGKILAIAQLQEVQVKMIRELGDAVDKALNDVANMVNVPKGVISELKQVRAKVDLLNQTFEAGQPSTQPVSK